MRFLCAATCLPLCLLVDAAHQSIDTFFLVGAYVCVCVYVFFCLSLVLVLALAVFVAFLTSPFTLDIYVEGWIAFGCECSLLEFCFSVLRYGACSDAI